MEDHGLLGHVNYVYIKKMEDHGLLMLWAFLKLIYMMCLWNQNL